MIKIHTKLQEAHHFRAMTAIGTGIALGGATQTGFVPTTPTVTLRNGGSADNRNPIFLLDYVRCTITAAGVAITRTEAAIVLDNITRYSSGGSALTVVNSRMSSAAASQAVVHGGAIIAVAASS